MALPVRFPGIGGTAGCTDGLPANRMKNYLFVDYATQAYLLLAAALVLLFHGETVPYWPLLILAHALVVVALHWLVNAYARAPKRVELAFFRHFYPILLYAPFYREIGALNQMFTNGVFDHQVIRIEQWLFGFQPGLALMDRFPSAWVGEVFYLSYFSYYVMIAGVGLALFLRDRAQFFHFVSVTSFVFYCCYLAYIFYPVIGPRVFYSEIPGYVLPADLQALYPAVTFPEAVQAGVFFQIMGVLYDYFEPAGAAFPSSHVAVAIVTALFSTRYLPRIRGLHWFMVVMMSISTVYCRYHYAVDVLAGVLTALLLIPVAEWLYRRYGGAPGYSARS
jgi:membrane-associated phospholipid phosphatase